MCLCLINNVACMAISIVKLWLDKNPVNTDNYYVEQKHIQRLSMSAYHDCLHIH